MKKTTNIHFISHWITHSDNFHWKCFRLAGKLSKRFQFSTRSHQIQLVFSFIGSQQRNLPPHCFNEYLSYPPIWIEDPKHYNLLRFLHLNTKKTQHGTKNEKWKKVTCTYCVADVLEYCLYRLFFCLILINCWNFSKTCIEFSYTSSFELVSVEIRWISLDFNGCLFTRRTV